MICGARRESITAERVFRIRTRLPSSSPTIRCRSMIVPQRAGAAHGTRRCACRCEERGGNTRSAGGRRPRPRSTAQSPLQTMRPGTGTRVRTPAPSSSPTTMRRSSANAPQRAGAAQRKVAIARRCERRYSFRAPGWRTDRWTMCSSANFDYRMNQGEADAVWLNRKLVSPSFRPRARGHRAPCAQESRKVFQSKHGSGSHRSGVVRYECVRRRRQYLSSGSSD
jgi:hypothetical protein